MAMRPQLSAGLFALAYALACGPAAARAEEPAEPPVEESGEVMEHSEEAADSVPARTPPAGAPMTAERLVELLRTEKLAPEGDLPSLTFYVGSVRIYVIVDAVHDRMRFAVPLAKTEAMRPENYQALLKANYQATRDVRFAVNRGVVWLLYLHPLSSLTEADALSAINQLVRLAQEQSST